MKKLLIPFLIIFAACTNSNSDTDIDKEYSWSDALEKLHNGEVETVFQSHNLDVQFSLENGEKFTVKEPEIDAIFEEVEKCGKKCDDIELITE